MLSGWPSGRSPPVAGGLSGLSFLFFDIQEQGHVKSKKHLLYGQFCQEPLSLVSGILKILFIFLKERPRVLFSTGAEIAIPSFYIGKFIFQTKLIYLESGAQVFSPSLTGKWVYPIADLFLVQWEPLLKHYGSKAKYVGGLI